MKKIIITIFVFLYFSVAAYGGQVNTSIQWTFNGVESLDVLGFKVYVVAPDGTVNMAQDIQDPTARTWTGDLIVNEGRNFVYFTAYNEGRESDPSNKVPMEYIETATPGIPPPTVIIRFN